MKLSDICFQQYTVYLVIIPMIFIFHWCCRLKLFTFWSSQKPLGQFQSNLAQSIICWRVFQFNCSNEGPRYDLWLLKKCWCFSKIFFKTVLPCRKAETCVEASSGSVDLSLLKLWTPGVGWATIGGQIFTQKCIDKKFSGIPFSQKSWNLCESFKLWFPAEVCTTRHKYIETTKGAWYVTLKYVNKSQKIYFLILSKIYTVLNCQDIWIWY